MLHDMINGFGHRLRLVLRQPDQPEDSVAVPSGDDAPPEVDFVAYAEDGRLSGRIRLDTSRLSDMLNEHDEFLLQDILAEKIPDGGTMRVPEFLVRRDELILVHATGPRGDRSRRLRTAEHGIHLRVGPYLVEGQMHAAHGVDPLIFFRRRRAMIPLTDATIEYSTVEGTIRESAGTIVVNRDHLDWVQRVEPTPHALDVSGIVVRGMRPTSS